jgi:predicted PhzF superfamily epimerase YddE/YHI9
METYNRSDKAVLRAPEYAPVKENEQVLLSLGITADHIAALPIIVHTGAFFLLLEVRNLDVLQALHPVPENISLLSDLYQLSGFCIFCRDMVKTAAATARIFTRFSGDAEPGPIIPAAGALACYLYDIAMIKKEEMTIFQVSASGAIALEQITILLHIQDGKIHSLQPVQARK